MPAFFSQVMSSLVLPGTTIRFPRPLSPEEASSLLNDIVEQLSYIVKYVNVVEGTKRTDKKLGIYDAIDAEQLKGYITDGKSSVEFTMHDHKNGADYGGLELHLGPKVSRKDDERKVRLCSSINFEVQMYFKRHS